MDTRAVNSLVLDATPLITQPASALQQYAHAFYTTPGVRAELRDEHARNQLMLWHDVLQVRQPKQKSINKVSAFAKLTGDYAVLSMNDVHIIALAYELEVERNGDASLRSYTGEKLTGDKEVDAKRFEQSAPPQSRAMPESDDGFQVVQRKKRHSVKYYRQQWQKQRAMEQAEKAVGESREEQAEQAELQTGQHVEQTELSVEKLGNKAENTGLSEALSEDAAENPNDQESEQNESNNGDDDGNRDDENGYDEDDDDGEWITPENFKETIMKDDNETVQETTQPQPLVVALATGDFACQNTAMQLGLKLLNAHSGKQITKVRNYMYRCHACFRMLPLPKSGEKKVFCTNCGGDTLLRCAVSVDSLTGKVTPHLKANFQWIRKGQVYSIASPLSKNTLKKQGRAGYQHNKENRHKALQEPVILREDQKEYEQALQEDARARRKNGKLLSEWVGGGSVDNFISPFQKTFRSGGVQVGRGRNANAVKKRK
ncbi:D-site 20S pre-rRNA nuclease [Metschnikowia bicuspidata]|uniref:20S-pre-rRNA D-site endonuclease NOB1 n=1 Tax=Metschnikowia bicuspidata TaxID=27322 RepID=A0A4P9ZHW5_9ASCO|nr:D-site 20S pre-rRNA nuclease [Metschnikowia bicuspidata]